MKTNSNNDPVCCFKEWMNIQEQDLSELLQAQHLETDHDDHNTQDDQRRQLIERIIQHFQEYIKKRACLAREINVSTFFAPSWCTPLECSVMWIAGCRPTIFIRLLYALIGEEIESQLEEFLQGRRTGNLGDTSPTQMNLINSLHCKTIKEEDKVSVRLASLQEEMADTPISIVARQARTCHGMPGKEIGEALEKHARSMLTVMEEADNLRLETLKELISILTPIQAVNFLAASKKLHLCLHEWTRPRGTMCGDQITSGVPEQSRVEDSTNN